ncbi:MAG: hypothetical protein ABSD43_11085 [Terracidiphilus sp.]
MQLDTTPNRYCTSPIKTPSDSSWNRPNQAGSAALGDFSRVLVLPAEPGMLKLTVCGSATV